MIHLSRKKSFLPKLKEKGKVWYINYIYIKYLYYIYIYTIHHVMYIYPLYSTIYTLYFRYVHCTYYIYGTQSVLCKSPLSYMKQISQIFPPVYHSLSCDSCGVKNLLTWESFACVWAEISHGAVPEPKYIFYVIAILYSHWFD